MKKEALHTKNVHLREMRMEKGVRVGRGCLTWMIVLCLLFLCKVAADDSSRSWFVFVCREIGGECRMPALLAVLAVNVSRWAIAYTYIQGLRAKAPSQAVLAGVIVCMMGLEWVVAINPAKGGVGIFMRYMSFVQLMKIISYVLASAEALTHGWEPLEAAEGSADGRRKAAARGRGGKQNASELCKFARFMTYPTICYQNEYPLRSSISAKKTLLFSLLIPVAGAVMFHSIRVKAIDCARAFLACPSLNAFLDVFIYTNIGWLAGFVFLFVGIPGLIAELTYFGDMLFFDDWWNVGLREYWRKWNVHIHTWLKRHVYFPVRKQGVSKGVAEALIFMGSGVVHEYILGDGLGNRGLGFFTMASQSPLVYLSEVFSRRTGISENTISIVALNLVGAPVLAILSQYKYKPKL